MLMDPNPSQQHVPMSTTCRLSTAIEETMPKARLKPNLPKPASTIKPKVVGGANRYKHVLVTRFICTI